MSKKVKMLLIPLFLTVLLIGCTSKPLVQTQIKTIQTKVPSKYLEDKKLPSVPTNATMQSETSAYMIDLFHYAIECKDDKKSIRKILENKGSKND